jgi:FkbM family methyltransferase
MPLNEPLFALLQPKRVTQIVDVGANPIEGEPPYKSMLERRLCRVVGFEPQQSAFDELNRRKSEFETYLPYLIGDGEKALLHVCHAPGMTSLLAPNPKMLRHFHGFSQWGKVVETLNVLTRRFDDIEEIDEVDFLKIDVQVGEQTVFRHGRHKLSRAVAIQTEVSFLPLYKNQPLFAEIDLELRQQGFVPHAFAAINKRMIAPLTLGNDPFAAINQLLEADVVYVRDFTRVDGLEPEQLKHLALIAHYCYGSYDLALHCIDRLAKSEEINADAEARYIAMLDGAQK